MEEYNKDAWIEIVERCQDAGVDAFELNFSCPHGLPERKMGAAMGQDPEILEEVCGWVMSAAKKPVWAKMTPNVTHIEDPSRAALRGGCHGRQRDQHDPQRHGRESRYAAARADASKATPRPAVIRPRRCKPIALRMVMEIAHDDPQANFPAARSPASAASRPATTRRSSSCSARDTVQVCTGVMKFGYECVKPMCDELLAFMAKHKFETLADFKGKSLDYFTTHADLVQTPGRTQSRARKPPREPRRKWSRPTANGAATTS